MGQADFGDIGRGGKDPHRGIQREEDDDDEEEERRKGSS
jgi:hypothetical protein